MMLKRPSFGSWITFRDPASAEIMARAGFDWLAIDMEHSPITLDSAQELIRVIDLNGVRPVVRLSSNDPVQAKRVLDAGARGLIVPMVNSGEEAAAAVAMAKYPPQGRRSFGLARAQDYGPGFGSYVRKANADVLVVVQIEHIDAVENAEAILSTPGVDAFFIGPYDLSGSMGIPGRLEHPKVRAAVRRVTELGRRLGVPAGVHIVEPDPAEALRRVREGFKFIALGTDFLYLGGACRGDLGTVRKGLRK